MVEEDVNTIETTGARAALRFDISENVDVTLGLIYQDVALRHGHTRRCRDAGVGDLKQVRFEDESLDDEWYQAALTLNAATAVRRPRRRGVLLRPRVSYEADASDYEFNFKPSSTPIYDGRLCQPYASTISAATRAASRTNDEQTEITTFEARLQSNNDAESRWSWLAGVFYSKETGTRSSTAS